MAIPLPWTHVAGILAGVGIVAVGAFVLVARPHAPLHRLFFLLALVDGASTLLFRLSYHDDAAVGAFLRGLYWYYYLAFIGVLLVFGALFPKPIAKERTTWLIVGGIAATTLLVEAAYVRDHAAFWTLAEPGAATRFTNGPWGNAMGVVFTGAIALVLVRTAGAFLHDPSPSHRRQAALVMGGMVLAYAPQPTTILVTALADAGLQPLFASRVDRVVAYWAYLLFCVSLVATAWSVARRGRTLLSPEDRRFLLLCYAGVTALTLLAIVLADPAIAQVLRQIALLAYPAVLGYAIARYEVFDIDRQIRRGAMVTLAAAALTLAFIMAESVAEGVLQQRIFGGFSSGWMSGASAAIVTAVAFVPVVRASRKAAARIVPELSTDELHVRKLEIYEHSVRGALADGILREGESRTLAALRSSLGITDSEHQRIVSEALA